MGTIRSEFSKSPVSMAGLIARTMYVAAEHLQMQAWSKGCAVPRIVIFRALRKITHWLDTRTMHRPRNGRKEAAWVDSRQQPSSPKAITTASRGVAIRSPLPTRNLHASEQRRDGWSFDAPFPVPFFLLTTSSHDIALYSTRRTVPRANSLVSRVPYRTHSLVAW
jgi:hypothetical protein